MLTVEPVDKAWDEVALMEAVASDPCCFLLDSSLSGPHSRFSIVGADPFLLVTARGRQVYVTTTDGIRKINDDPIEVLRRLLDRYRVEPGSAPNLPFTGGAVGYLGYELGRHIERLPATGIDDLALPEMAFGFYDEVHVLDKQEGCIMRVRCRPPGVSAGPRGLRFVPDPASLPRKKGSNFTHDEYIDAVRRVRDYIVEGDIFQANLSQRFADVLAEPPWQFYCRLRRENPAPFAAFLDFGGFQVASSSPERFLRVSGRNIETRPIKGTVGRSQDPKEDALLALDLEHSEKDRAELAMIVDLERNDLGRISVPGGVRVGTFPRLETYRGLHHLVTDVVGEVRPECSAVDVVAALFPGGSITGAPKLRSMEAIAEIEGEGRGFFTGSLGFIDARGRATFNILIRTIIHRAVEGGGREVSFHVGGGITWSSDPESEDDETMLKASAMVAALSGSALPATP